MVFSTTYGLRIALYERLQDIESMKRLIESRFPMLRIDQMLSDRKKEITDMNLFREWVSTRQILFVNIVRTVPQEQA